MRTLLTLLLFVPLIGFSQSSSFVDSRDGKEYKTIKIGDRVWMAENLAFFPDSGNYKVYAYDNDSSNVLKYGYLYDFEAANNVCPTGWHLPSKDEFGVLIELIGGEVVYYEVWTNGLKLKSKTEWLGDGTDNIGFNGLPGGSRVGSHVRLYNGSKFAGLGELGTWWSSTGLYSGFSLGLNTGKYNEYVTLWGSQKSCAKSVRCIKD